LPAKAWAQVDAKLLDILVAAYPDDLNRHEDGVLAWRDGTRRGSSPRCTATAARARRCTTGAPIIRLEPMSGARLAEPDK
jgi:hypothetical protein